MPAKMITLRNGSREIDVLAAGTVQQLQKLQAADPIAFYELVMKCRDDSYQFANDGKSVVPHSQLVIQHYATLNINGGVHSNLRNIVLSAVEGDGYELYIVSPFA